MSPAVADARDEADRVARLYERYAPLLLALLLRKLPTRQDAEDLSQDIFKSLVEAKSLQHVENLPSYLYSVANHAISKFHAKRDMRAPIDDSLAALEEMRQVPCESAESQASLQLIAAEIEAAFARMPRVCRLVGYGCLFMGRTTAEMADELRMPSRTVERHRHTAMRMLRDALYRDKP